MARRFTDLPSYNYAQKEPESWYSEEGYRTYVSIADITNVAPQLNDLPLSMKMQLEQKLSDEPINRRSYLLPRKYPVTGYWQEQRNPNPPPQQFGRVKS